jgi:thiamine pyrophosphate-dependent acetolactate synthase large subunit-like protein
VPTTAGALLDLGRVMTWLRDRLPDDAIVTSDAGNEHIYGRTACRTF